MSDGFDLSELDKFSKDILAMANDNLPKESRKFIKKQGTKLSKKDKSVYDCMGIGEGSKEMKKAFKAGKAYKYNGAYSVRAYNKAVVESKDGKKYSLGAMLNNGFRHVNRDGSETWVPGYHFMEKALSDFESEYIENCEEFIEEIISKLF